MDMTAPRDRAADTPALPSDMLQALARDANAVALVKAYFAIPDDAVRKKLRRLAEEIAVPVRKTPQGQ